MSSVNRRVLLFANTDWYLFNFRLSLAERLRSSGWDVVLVSPPGEYGERLQKIGFRWIPLSYSTRSTNPFHELVLIGKLIKLYRQERPQLVHHFTIKCVLYGTIAAKLVGGIKIVNAVTGLGHIFTDPGMKARLIRPVVRGLYRLALNGSNVLVIYHNSCDRDSFCGWGVVDRDRTRLVRGSGVNVQKFQLGQMGDQKNEIVKLLFASRLLREKGIFELIEAFKVVRSKHPQCELLIAGDVYPENPSSLTSQDIDKLKKTEGVFFLGHFDDMQSLLTKCDIVVLPSYREGTPRILIEAAAMEKPIVATDIAGCLGLVVDGVNGLLVPIKDSKAITDALEKLIIDPNLRIKFGKAGREIVLGEFDEKIVLKKTFEVYEELLGKK